jgi:hypothetical protein
MTFHVKVAERWGTKSLGMGVIAVAVAAVIGVIASVSKASAGTVTVNDMSWWGDSGVSVTILGVTYSGFPIGPQQITVGGSSSVFNAWCIDFNNDVSVPGTYAYDEVALTTSATNGLPSAPAGYLASTEPVGVENNVTALDEISYLIDQGLNLPTSTSGLTSAQLEADDNEATAIQIAIWDILYGTSKVAVTQNGLDNTDWNTLTGTYGLVATDVQDSQNAGAPSMPVYALLDSGGVQELAFAAPDAVPEPSSLALLAGATLGVTMLQRRKAKG